MDGQNTSCNHEGWDEDMPEKLMVCRNIAAPLGDLAEIYIGPSGIFVVACSCTSPGMLFHDLRERLGNPHVRLYVADQGIYDPFSDSVLALSEDSDLDNELISWTLNRRCVFDESARLYIKKQLIQIDASVRGEYIDNSGTVHVLRRGNFVPSSNLDPNILYWLTMLGSSFGLHRFYMGKFFSGLLYLLTSGLFGFGWLVDGFALLTGLQRDKKHRLVRTPSNRPKKLAGALVGLLVTVFFLILYLRFLQLASNTLSSGLDTALNNPEDFIRISHFLKNFSVLD